MIHRIRRLLARLLALFVVPSIIAGCADNRDQRLAGFAQDAMATQSKQNQHMADQATAVVKESHKLAEAAGDLVEQDAHARHDMILAFRDLTSQLNLHKAVVDAGRERLESERRDIARLRVRDPIIAAAIQGLGLLLASMFPLGMVGFVIYQMNRQEPDHVAVSELLITDLASNKPLIWPGLQQQLMHRSEPLEELPEQDWGYGEDAEGHDELT